MLVDEAVSTRFREVAVSGGEPFLHPRILPMLEYATIRINTVVLTNGTLLEIPRLDGLKRINTRNLTVQVSLDSATPDFHDARRGRGCWEKAVSGIRLLIDLGFHVAVRATVTDQTDDELDELRRFLYKLGVHDSRFYTMPVVKGGRSREGIEYSFSDLVPEPTVARDGLFWHPLKVDRSLCVAPDPFPLEGALLTMAEKVREVKPPCSSLGYR